MPEHYTDHIFYHGPSMYPTLRTLDRLIIRPCSGNKDIRIGDVIVFRKPGAQDMVIHRAIGIADGGYLTRGDNNKFTDSWIVAKKDIIGCVNYIRRGKKTRYILGGKTGLMYTSILMLLIGFWRQVAKNLHSSYFWLSQHSFLKKMAKKYGWLSLREFNLPEGNESQVILFGRLVIARRLPKKNWHTRRPFRLLIDESMLD